MKMSMVYIKCYNLWNILKAITNFKIHQYLFKYVFTSWHFAMDDPVECKRFFLSTFELICQNAMNICETWLITKVMFLTNIHKYMKSWNNILLILVLSTLNKLFCLFDIEVYLWCKRYINTVGGAQQARPAAWASYCIVKCRLISITFWYSSPGRRINCSLNWKHFNGRLFFLLF